jgi:tetratricopeptide (TPR) repeat protein
MLLLSAQAVKSREVYTTLYTSDTAPLASFYTPNAAYTRHNFFGPNETPLAVITGYDSYSMTLELDDLSNGAILLSKDIYTRIGRTSYQPLLIAKSGEYKVRVLLGNSELDSYAFKVEREPVLTAAGKPNYEAIISRTSMLMFPNSNEPALYLARASAYEAKGEMDNAIADCSKAIQLRPYDANAYTLRAFLYDAKTNWADALSDWNESVRLKPDNPRGLFGRAYVFEKMGNFEKAILDLEKAIQIFPEDFRGTNTLPGDIIDLDAEIPNLFWRTRSSVSYDRICNRLAWLLATCPDAKLRDAKKSIGLAMESCQLTSWKSAQAIDTLATGYAESGDFDSAIQFEKQALQLTNSTPKRLETFQQRLSLYEQHQAYHQASN